VPTDQKSLKKASREELLEELHSRNPEGIFVVLCENPDCCIYEESTRVFVKATPEGVTQIFRGLSGFMDDYANNPGNSKKNGDGFDQNFTLN